MCPCVLVYSRLISLPVLTSYEYSAWSAPPTTASSPRMLMQSSGRSLASHTRPDGSGGGRPKLPVDVEVGKLSRRRGGGGARSDEAETVKDVPPLRQCEQ